MRPVLLLFCLLATAYPLCHYTCFDSSSCGTPDYYNCTLCASNRGTAGKPINGMCYCDNSSDED